MKSYVCLDLDRIKALAATVKTCGELIEELQHEVKDNSLKKSIPLNFYNIRKLAISSKSIDELVEYLKMDIDLLEDMKKDGVVLLDARWETEIMYCYMCTINPEISEKYGFNEGIWGAEYGDRMKSVIADIQEKLDKSFNLGDMFFTYEFIMNLPEEICTMDGLIAYIQSGIDLLINMDKDGVYLPKGFICEFEYDGQYLMEFRTKDLEVAKVYGFKKPYDFIAKKEVDADYYLNLCQLDDFFV